MKDTRTPAQKYFDTLTPSQQYQFQRRWLNAQVWWQARGNLNVVESLTQALAEIEGR
jgi:hypothetical protein